MTGDAEIETGYAEIENRKQKITSKKRGGNMLVNTGSLEFRRAARAVVLGQRRYGGRGRTDRITSVTWSTHVVIIPNSDQAPIVCGLGYWKTNFRNGDFSKTLYTPSTFRIEVGENWKGDV